MAKRYKDVPGDGGSDVAGQLGVLHNRLEERMSQVKYKIAVMSGKGGVGKSTVTVNLAAGLAALGHKVGVVDADIYGPSLAQMLGVRKTALTVEAAGVTPAVTEAGIKVMSMDLLLPEDQTPVVWDGPQADSFTWKGTMEMHALREFLTDTQWGDLDFLLIDLPPGTNQFATLHDLLPKLDGSVVVSVPSRVSNLVVRRSISMINKVLKGRIYGVVENMSAYYCSDCDAQRPLFGEGQQDYDGVPVIGRVPFDPRMAQACDRGVPYVAEHGQTSVGVVLNQLCEAVARFAEDGES